VAITLPILNARVIQCAPPTLPNVEITVDGEPLPSMWYVEVENFGGPLAICDTEREARAVLGALELDKLLDRIGRRLAVKAV
jgi:hypothetical protein